MKQWDYITNEIGADIKVLDMPSLDSSKQSNSLDSKFISNLVYTDTFICGSKGKIKIISKNSNIRDIIIDIIIFAIKKKLYLI